VGTRIHHAARTILCLLLALPLATIGKSEERFFAWTSLQFPREEYQARRAKLAQQLRQSGGGVYLTPSRPGLSHGEPFRQLDAFLYFTGLELPDSVFVLDAESGRAVVFAPARDLRFENATRANDFPGRPLADDPVLPKVSGLDDVRPTSDFEGVLASHVAAGRVLRVAQPAEREKALVAPFDAEAELVASLRRIVPRARLESARSDVAVCRMVKSPAEIDVLRRAARLSARALEQAAAFVADGVDERKLEAEFEAACKHDGSQRVAFASIVKSGPNALFPWRLLAAHYDRRNRILRNGEIVVFDVGCELDHYASDVGRTFPVWARFHPEQRRVLETAVAVADAMIAAVRPGVTLGDVQAAGVTRIPEAERGFMQAALYFGHHVGLAAADPQIDDARLEPGMVLTVEPWYHDGTRGLAAFTEDMVLVTATGALNLTASLPRTAAALEAAVKADPRRPRPR
jgi:Xaa-Pro aminopeptidase